MPIQTDTDELMNLDIEITRVQKQLSVLRKQRSDCEQRILAYLERTKQPGLRMNGRVLVAREKQKRRYQKKTERVQRGAELLEKHGVRNSEGVLQELVDAMKGSPEVVKSLRFTNV